MNGCLRLSIVEETRWKGATVERIEGMQIEMGRQMNCWGDFNMVLRREERTDVSFLDSLAGEFRDKLEEFDLIDLPLTGSPWTWTNQRANLSYSRIDRFFLYSDLLIQFAGLTQKTLQQPILDHFLICLASNGIQ